MTEGDTGWGDPPEVAQPQVWLASQPWMGELELDADGLPIQDRPAPSQTYLIATACLAGSLVSAGLAVAEMAGYPNGVGNLAILGVITGLLGGATPLVDEWKPPGWAGRISIVAAWLGLISAVILMVFFWGPAWVDGGRVTSGAEGPCNRSR